MIKYNNILSAVAAISTEYMPVLNEYQSIYSLFSDFLNDYPKAGDYKSLVPYNISTLNDYRVKVDKIALNDVNEWLSGAYS